MRQGLLYLEVFLAVFLGVAVLLAYLSRRLQRDVWRGVNRLRQASGEPREGEERGGVGGLVWDLLFKSGGILLPRMAGRIRLESRLSRAGLTGPGAARVFVGVQLLLAMLLPGLAFLLCSAAGLPPGGTLLLCGGAAGVGVVAPGLWVDRRRAKRQSVLRRSLPDALDLMVLCLEGGGTLSSALQRVAEDLEAAHPLLAAEWRLIQHEMRMGLSAGEAVQRFGERCDLEDVRDLAVVLQQAERFGTGMAKTLRLHADASRLERRQRAEETAQKASVKILFPTLLCIFPAIFIVLLGPAALQIARMLARPR